MKQWGSAAWKNPGDAAYQPPGAPSGQDTQILHQKQRREGLGYAYVSPQYGFHVLPKKAHLGLEAQKHSISLDILLATQIHFVGTRYVRTWCWFHSASCSSKQ